MEDDKKLTKEELEKLISDLNEKSKKPQAVDLTIWIDDNIPKTDFSDLLKKTHFSFETHMRLPNEKRYIFSPDLTNTPFTRINITSWQYAINFLLNYCNQFLSSSENEEAQSLLNSGILKEAIDQLFYKQINLPLLKEIISKNKPFFSFNTNRVALLRRNALFIKLYLETVENNYKSRFLLIDRIAKYFIFALVKHELFFDNKACLFLSKEYSKTITTQKLATIKYFNNEILGQLETLFVEQNLDFSWLQKVREIYSEKFGKDYATADMPTENRFTFFSKDELDMVVFILAYNTTICGNIPYTFTELILKLLIEYGVSPVIIHEMVKDLSKLGIVR